MLQVVGAAIVRRGTVLATRRSYPPQAAGRWEFPGGKVGVDETPDAALIREIDEELGCAVRVVEWLPEASSFEAGGADLELRVALCDLVEGEPDATEHEAMRWLTPEELGDLDWLEPDRPFLEGLAQHLLDGEPLAGGNVGTVTRIGDTVRRPTGPWTPAVHALLKHLTAAGLLGVPRVHGIDARGRESLAFLPGEVIDVDTDLLSEARLANLGRWLRAMHEAAAGFNHPGPWRWFGTDAPELVSHNDVAPYNVAFDGDRVSGVFDWDFAGPSTATNDLGHTAWTAIPLFRPIPTDLAAQRLRIFADGYGTEPDRVLDAVAPRVRLAIDGIGAAIARGELPGLAAVGEPRRTEVALEGFLARIVSIRNAR